MPHPPGVLFPRKARATTRRGRRHVRHRIQRAGRHRRHPDRRRRPPAHARHAQGGRPGLSGVPPRDARAAREHRHRRALAGRRPPVAAPAALRPPAEEGRAAQALAQPSRARAREPRRGRRHRRGPPRRSAPEPRRGRAHPPSQARRHARRARGWRRMKPAKAEEKEEAQEEPTRPEDDVEMTFFEHLAELRTRLIRALLAILPGFVVGWIFREEIMALILRPYLRATTQMGMRTELVFTDPSDALFWYLVVSLIAALMFASPVIFWQLWGFISPGLYRREKRMALPFVAASTLLFAAGVYFCYEVVLQPTFMLFFSFAGEVGDSGVA